MSKLSPAAQAVLNSAMDSRGGRFRVSAALRAAANQAENIHPAQPFTEWGEGWLEGVKDVVASFRRIADELEGH